MLSFAAAIRTAVAAIVLVVAANIGITPALAGNSPKDRFLNQRVPPPAGVPGRWRLILDSEFTGPRLPPQWRAGWFGRGVTAPVNGSEPACYSPVNVTLPDDGTLHLSVTARPSRCGGRTRPYTGAMVTSDPAGRRPGAGFQYTFGVLQARVYVPAVAAGRIADWPAVWTDGQSWPVDGEDDLMEGLDGTACFHFHDPSGHPGGCDRGLSPGWHTFASDWRPGLVTYYYDGVRVGAVSAGITAAPMYIVLDDTVRAAAAPVTAAGSMRVAYVRVWQHR